MSAMSACRSDIDLSPGTRAYVHVPNPGVNVKLNLLLFMAVTAVVGLGIGNYLGWSANSHKQLSMAQVMKLKQLQDELIICMESQERSGQPFEDNNSICHGNIDHWKGKFEKLFNESIGMKSILEKHHRQEYPMVGSKPVCDTASASEEFHKISLDLIVKQMDHLKVCSNIPHLSVFVLI